MSLEHQSLYEPLPRVQGSIRLLRVFHEAIDDMICCELLNGNINERYQTLSYTWGSVSTLKCVVINDRKVSVRRNLWEFLKVARQHYSDKLFWIDAICINQNDEHERNQQVRMMGSIYKSSNLTLIWLGPLDYPQNGEDPPSSNTFDKIELRKIDRQLSRVEEDLSNIAGMSIRKICERLPEVNDLDPVREALDLLFRHPYWSRMWIIQELNLSSKKILLFDGKRANWSSLKRLVDEIDSLYIEVVEVFESTYKKKRPGKEVPRWQLRETIERLKKAQSEGLAYAMITQNAPRSKAVDRESNIVAFLQRYEDARCFDRRDKLYGLHSMISHIIDFPIDYAANVYEIYYQACHVLDDYRVWPAQFSDSDVDSSESDGTLDTDRDSLDMTEKNHFQELALQLIRTFDLGPLDLIFGDQQGRTFAISLSEQVLPEQSREITLLHTIPEDDVSEKNIDEICQLAITHYENVGSTLVIGLCPRCKRILLFDLGDGHSDSGLGTLQCFVDNSITMSKSDSRENHLILLDSSWVGASSVSENFDTHASASDDIDDDEHHDDTPGDQDNSESDSLEWLDDSEDSKDSNDSTSNGSDGSYYDAMLDAYTCYAKAELTFDPSTSSTARRDYSRKDLSLLLELHATFWTSDLNYHGGGTRHEFVNEREEQNCEQREKFQELLNEAWKDSSIATRCYYTTSMLDALHLEKKARGKLIEALERVEICLQT